MPERKLQPSSDPDVTASRFPARTKLIAIAGIAGTLIGAAGIVVPLVASAGTRNSSVDTIEVLQQGDGAVDPTSVVQPIAADLTTQVGGAAVDYSNMWSGSYAVPVDSDWAELWSLRDDFGCYSQLQVAWLETHGVLIPDPFLSTSISNTATSGSPVTIRNVRLQGVVTPPAGDTVTVTYPVCIGDETPGIYGHITVGIDPVAVYDKCYNPDAYQTGVRGCRVGEGEVPPIPGDPLVFDVYPGAIQPVILTWDQVADFTGRFVADMEVDGQVHVIDLTPPGPDIVSPTVTRPALLSIGEPSITYCQADTNDATTVIAECTLEQWLAILAD